jgi:hypothetical protein
MAGKVAKRITDSVSSGTVNVWALLTNELSAAPCERPENSVTPEEFAERTGYSVQQAAKILRSTPKLKRMRYRIGQSNRSAFCYVPNDDPPEAA